MLDALARFRSRGSALLALALLGACACATTPRPRRSRSASPSAPTPTRAGASADPTARPIDLEMERLLAERDRLADPRTTFAYVKQAKPASLRQLRAVGAFPSRSISRGTLYAFRFAHTERDACADDKQLPFTKSGLLCDDVVAPGVEMSPSERDLVIGLITTAAAKWQLEQAGETVKYRPVTRCGFDPHHAVVFTDAAGAVVAKLVVCFSCSEWLVVPATAAVANVIDEATANPAMMTDAEREALREMFDRHGLSAWQFAGGTPELLAYETAVYGREGALTAAGEKRRAARLAPGSGAPKHARLRDLDAADRQRLCDWVAREVRPRHGAVAAWTSQGYECPDGQSWTSDPSLPECAARPIGCDATVTEIEDCLRVFREPEDLCAPPPPACRSVVRCLPGIRAR